MEGLQAGHGLEAAHRAIASRRLANQRLSGQPGLDPVAVVRQFGAMQAQEFAVAKWSLGQRSTANGDATVQRLIDDGAILRTHALRPTWHFVAAEDIGWVQALTGPRVQAITAYYFKQHGVDEEMTRKSKRVIQAALSGGNHLTRSEIGQALAASGIEANGGRLAHLLMRAELDGLVASGVMRGKQQTYALISERVPDRVQLSRDEALRELTLRYFTAHGPATVKDFAWWASLTAADIKRGLGLAGETLTSEQIGGLTYWSATGESACREPSPSAHVLQAYDEYIVAYTQSRFVTNVARLPVNPPGRNVLVHPIVLDSQVIGYWRRQVTRDGLVAQPVLSIEPRPAHLRAVDKAFAAYARFAGGPLTVEWAEAADAA